MLYGELDYFEWIVILVPNICWLGFSVIFVLYYTRCCNFFVLCKILTLTAFDKIVHTSV